MTVTIAVEALLWLLGVMTVVWLVSFVRRDLSTVDLFWAVAILVAAWVYFGAANVVYVRHLVVLGLVHLWGFRLSFYLLRRNWGQPEDRRYRAMRERRGKSFAWTSLFIVFWLQAIVAWLISLPLYVALTLTVSQQLTWLDWFGLVVFTVGFSFEVVGDWQLAHFKNNPAHSSQVCDRGLWRYTRHPNYFGEAVLWWGLSCFALGIPGSGWVIIGPVFMTLLLLKVSGVSLVEQHLRHTKAGYDAYASRTSAFIPWFPKA